MATKKRLSLIYELENFADTYLGKVTKFQGDGLFRFGVVSNLLAWTWKPPPPGMNRVKGRLPLGGTFHAERHIKISTCKKAELSKNLKFPYMVKMITGCIFLWFNEVFGNVIYDN